MTKVFKVVVLVLLNCTTSKGFEENTYCTSTATLFWNIMDPIFKVIQNESNYKILIL